MAYTHSKYEVQMAPYTPTAFEASRHTGLNLAVTGLQGHWTAGFVPHIIRGAAVHYLATVVPDAAISVGFEADISAAGTPTRLFTIVVPTARAGGHKVYYYRPTYHIEIKPGMVVDARVTAAATAGVRGRIVLYVEPRWEEPGNLTGMIATT